LCYPISYSFVFCYPSSYSLVCVIPAHTPSVVLSQI
jgi:hypothetical protein